MTTDAGIGTPRPKRESHRGSSPQPVDVARALVDAVHRHDQVAVQRILRRPDLPRIAVILAEQIPAGPKQLKPCGTRGAAERHIARGELLDDACEEARRTYYRERSRRVRARPATSGPRSTSTTSSQTASSADVDPVAVDRFLGGDWAVPLNVDERFEIYRHLVSTGQPMSKDMQDRLAINGRRAKQFRARFSAATVTPAIDTHGDTNRQEASA